MKIYLIICYNSEGTEPICVGAYKRKKDAQKKLSEVYKKEIEYNGTDILEKWKQKDEAHICLFNESLEFIIVETNLEGGN